MRDLLIVGLLLAAFPAAPGLEADARSRCAAVIGLVVGGSQTLQGFSDEGAVGQEGPRGWGFGFGALWGGGMVVFWVQCGLLYELGRVAVITAHFNAGFWTLLRE